PAVRPDRCRRQYRDSASPPPRRSGRGGVGTHASADFQGDRQMQQHAGPSPHQRLPSSWNVLSCCNYCLFDTLALTEYHLICVDRLDQHATGVTLSPLHTRLGPLPLQPLAVGAVVVKVAQVAPLTLMIRTLAQSLWGRPRTPPVPVLSADGL